jgi:coatomer protein complex subunit alpha (xenin)
LETAYKTCIELKEKHCYKQLYQEAIRQGNHNLAEVSLQQLKEYDKLSFFYTFLGDRDKLRKMQKIAESRVNKES